MLCLSKNITRPNVIFFPLKPLNLVLLGKHVGWEGNYRLNNFNKKIHSQHSPISKHKLFLFNITCPNSVEAKFNNVIGWLCSSVFSLLAYLLNHSWAKQPKLGSRSRQSLRPHCWFVDFHLAMPRLNSNKPRPI